MCRNRLKNSFGSPPASHQGLWACQTVLGCPTLALPAQIHGAAGTEPREPCNGMVSAHLKCLHGPEPQTRESINSFPTVNRGFWHLTGRETFSFPAILPLPSQQMLHTNLLAANWSLKPLHETISTEQFVSGKKTPSTGKSYNLAPFIPAGDNFPSVARQPAGSKAEQTSPLD